MSRSFMRARVRSSFVLSSGHAMKVSGAPLGWRLRVSCLSVGGGRMVLVLKTPGVFLAADETSHGGVQGRGHAGLLSRARNCAAEELDLGRMLVPDVVKHGRRMIRPGADLIHLPGIFVQNDSRGDSHLLAFFNQGVQQVAERGGMTFVREMG